MSINFAYLNCPTCKKRMYIHPEVPVIGPLFHQELDLEQSIMRMAMKEAEAADMWNSERLYNPDDPFYRDFASLAVESCTFYQCQKCLNPYFGGMIDCR